MYFFVSIKEAVTGLIYLNQTYDIEIVGGTPPVIVEDTPIPTCDDDEVLVILP